MLITIITIVLSALFGSTGVEAHATVVANESPFVSSVTFESGSYVSYVG